MSMKCLTRLCSGMAFILQSSGRKRIWTEPENVEWAGSQPEPEEELSVLLKNIKERVYTLRDTVHEQSEQLNGRIEEVEQIVHEIKDEQDNESPQ